MNNDANTTAPSGSSHLYINVKDKKRVTTRIFEIQKGRDCLPVFAAGLDLIVADEVHLQSVHVEQQGNREQNQDHAQRGGHSGWRYRGGQQERHRNHRQASASRVAEQIRAHRISWTRFPA